MIQEMIYWFGNHLKKTHDLYKSNLWAIKRSCGICRPIQCLIYYLKSLGICNIFLDINCPKALKCLSDYNIWHFAIATLMYALQYSTVLPDQIWLVITECAPLGKLCSPARDTSLDRLAPCNRHLTFKLSSSVIFMLPQHYTNIAKAQHVETLCLTNIQHWS